jgi:hypothetical protein
MLPPCVSGGRVKLHAFTTPEPAGGEFSEPSWSTWRIIARLIDARGVVNDLFLRLQR